MFVHRRVSQNGVSQYINQIAANDLHICVKRRVSQNVVDMSIIAIKLQARNSHISVQRRESQDGVGQCSNQITGGI